MAQAIEEGMANEDEGSGAAPLKQRRKRRRGLISYAVSDISRFGRITAVLIKHGFGQFAAKVGLTSDDPGSGSADDLLQDPHGTAERLRAVFEELGPTFVKLGQVLSTRPDMLPPAYITELSKLQDQSPRIEFDIVEAHLEEALGRPWKEVFKRLEPRELATGSIAQTHLAELPDGRDVVVKVQRPGLHDVIRSDLDLLRMFARFLEATIEEMGLYRPSDIVDEFERALNSELDFTVEASHLKIFTELCADRREIWIPEVIEAHRTVLIMERIPGVKITDVEPETPRAKRLAMQLVDLAYSMLFDFGIFHGDPHPGNLLVTADDRIGLIDFGLIGRISRQQQDILVAMIIAIVAGDVDGIARSVMQLGRPMGRVPLREMRDDIAEIRGRYLRNSLGDIDVSQFILELLEAGQRYRIRVPADYAVLTKASVSMEGVIRHLHPSIDIPATLSPYSRKLLLARYGPDRLSQSLLTGALGVSGMVRELPGQLNQLLMDLEYEGLRVTVENEPLTDLRRSINVHGSKLSFAMLTSALTMSYFASAIFGAGPWATTSLIAGGLAVLLFIRVLLWHLLDGRRRKVRITPLLKFMKRTRGRADGG